MNEFYFTQEYDKCKGAANQWKCFVSKVADKFKEFDFTFKHAYKNATHYEVNDIPMYFESRGGNPHYLAFHEHAVRFPSTLRDEFDSNILLPKKFSTIEQCVSYFNDNNLQLYTRKKLKHIKRFGII